MGTILMVVEYGDCIQDWPMLAGRGECVRLLGSADLGIWSLEVLNEWVILSNKGHFLNH